MNIAILGQNFGDEGKGAAVHHLCSTFDFGIRTSGGNNAGHTIYYNGKKLIRHLVPSVDFSLPNIKAFLGSGMVINPTDLLKEVQDIETTFPGAAKRIYVDPDAFVIFQHHLDQDKENVVNLGSTGRGITPAYIDKTARRGTKLEQLIKDNTKEIQELKKLGVQFKYVMELKEELKKSKIIFEAAQSVMLDLNLGLFPYVTSGDATIASIYSSGFGFVAPQKIYGVAKAFSSRVAVGPFPTEFANKDFTDNLREVAKEYGSTTGRPRRLGAFDCPMVKYAAHKGNITNLIITKLDCLTHLGEVPVCIGYEKEPVSAKDFFDAKPVYQTLKPWKDGKDISQVEHFISTIEKYTGLPVSYISAGTSPEDFINYPQAKWNMKLRNKSN